VRAADCKAAVVTEQRLTAFRFLFLVARMKSGAALKLIDRPRISLRFIRATASDPTVMEPVTTTGFI
jgi:hypothetical protein